MSDMYAIERLYTGLDREGPGGPDDVAWALSHLALTDTPRICDAGCGSGADSVTLAQTLPDAQITALEHLPHLAREARTRCADLPNVTVKTADMAQINGPYDLIWCTGALYFLGVTEGLRGWRPALAPGGHIAFSEPVLLGPPDDTVTAFWQEYPAITDLDGIRTRVTAAGFECLEHRLIIGTPWARYYTPMQTHIATLKTADDPALREAVAETEQEIALWASARDRIAYALTLVRPV